MSSVVLLLATVSVGLFAGLCFCYTFVVIPTLAGMDDLSYVTTMNRLNKAVPGPAFFVVFAGSVVWSVLALLLHTSGQPTRATWLIGAGALCAVGALVVTVTGNVPLNGQLARVRTDGTEGSGGYAEARRAFEGRWNRLHRIRTALLVAGVVLLASAAIWGSHTG